MYKAVIWFVTLALCLFHNCSVMPSWFIEAGLVGSLWLDFEFKVFLDLLGSAYGLMLFSCGLCVLGFCVHYFGGWSVCRGLVGLLVVFLGVMVSLSFSGSLVLSLVLWEYLGFVSFFLILYYSSLSSLRASVITLISSRLGDVGLFVLFCWGFQGFSITGWLLCLSLFLVVSSKSACYPLMSWLIEAMRAPTPVSSLVHSSTLVAAGAWFTLRYGEFFSEGVVWSLSVSCCVSIILSAFCACLVSDVKKVVAFSTCNNISWCILYYLWGNSYLAICQLLVHGLCKSLLFMSVGDLMSSSGSSQSGVNIYSSVKLSSVNSLLSIVLVCCLCGLPFLGVFFTKHLFLSGCFSGSSVVCQSFLLIGVFLTSVYCFRFLSVMLGAGGGLKMGYLSFFVLSMGLVWVGFGTCWVLIGCLEEISVVVSFWGVILLIVQVSGCFVGWMISSLDLGLSFINWMSLVSGVFGCDGFVGGLYAGYNLMGWLLSLFIFRWEGWIVKRVLNYEDNYLHGFNSVVLSGVWVFLGLWIVAYLWIIIG